MNLLVLVIVVLVVVALLVWALRSAPIPQPFQWIVILLLVLVACWFILSKAGML